MIDSHQHFWQLARADYGWITPALAPIHRDFGPDDLAPMLARHGITQTILVQAAPTQAETRYLLALAHATSWVGGVVGWVDFDASQAPDAIATLASDALLVGLRPMVQDIADDAWLARPQLAPVFDAMTAHGLVLDALVLPRHLRALAVVLARHPALAVVLDHAGKPRIRDGGIGQWQSGIANLAQHGQLTCKLSGLLTEAPMGAEAAVLAPYVQVLIDRFGPARLMWGSDWPVVELAGGYDRWHAVSMQLLAGLSSDDRALVLEGTARRVYLAARGRPGPDVKAAGACR